MDNTIMQFDFFQMQIIHVANRLLFEKLLANIDMV